MKSYEKLYDSFLTIKTVNIFFLVLLICGGIFGISTNFLGAEPTFLNLDSIIIIFSIISIVLTILANVKTKKIAFILLTLSFILITIIICTFLSPHTNFSSSFDLEMIAILIMHLIIHLPINSNSNILTISIELVVSIMPVLFNLILIYLNIRLNHIVKNNQKMNS